MAQAERSPPCRQRQNSQRKVDDRRIHCHDRNVRIDAATAGPSNSHHAPYRCVGSEGSGHGEAVRDTPARWQHCRTRGSPQPRDLAEHGMRHQSSPMVGRRMQTANPMTMKNDHNADAGTCVRTPTESMNGPAMTVARLGRQQRTRGDSPRKQRIHSPRSVGNVG